MALIDDVHAKISRTEVRAVHRIQSRDALQTAIANAHQNGCKVSVAGGRHSLGRQPFVTDGVVLDLSGFDRVLGLNADDGVLHVEGGCRWPTIRQFLTSPANPGWEIHQKQTGVDNLTVAGSIAVNAHGNVLKSGPIASDIAWLKLVLASGQEVYCDRHIDAELFSLAIGGLGLVGVISEIGLRLAPQQTYRRFSAVTSASESIALWHRGDHPFEYGDMQLNVDPAATDFLSTGILNLREPVDASADLPKVPKANWDELSALAHVNKNQAFIAYCEHAKSANETLELRDDFFWDFYQDDYHDRLEQALGLPKSCDILCEFFIHAENSNELLASTRRAARRLDIDLVLATLRSIKACDTSFLRWARSDYVCLVMAVHTERNSRSFSRTDEFCRSICEFCVCNNGSFYLPYRSFASHEQLLAAYPNFDDFCSKKAEYDPSGTFSSDWFENARVAVWSS